jgi:hypothetical protein|tara:strand:- start:350 stop:556 length:207 start_codon:yes stop_codon:yes gene_type:complete
MSPLNTLAGGYKGGSPRVRSENSKKDFSGQPPTPINVNEFVNQIKMWVDSGKLSQEDIQTLINELNKL